MSQLFDILQSCYYSERTHYLWQYIANGQQAPAKNHQVIIKSIDDFAVMQSILSYLRYTPSAFAEICQRNRRYAHLRCSLSHNQQILQVESRTFVLKFSAHTHRCTIDLHPEVKDTLGIRNPHWSHKLSAIFAPSRLYELDKQLHSRYQSKIDLQQWIHSEQFDIDLAYFNQMPSYILSLYAEMQMPKPIGQQLNIILEGNQRVRIGMVNDYSPEEMMELPSYPREQWREGIQRAFTGFKDEMQQMKEEFLSTFTPVFEAVKQVMAGQATHNELPNRRSIRLTTYEGVSRQLLADIYGDNQDSRSIDDEHSATEQTEAMFQTGIDDPMLLKMMRDNAAWDARESQAFIQSADYQPTLEAIRHILHVTAPLIAYNGPEHSVNEHYKLHIQINNDTMLNVSVTMFNHHRVSCQFDTADIKRTFRPWWANRQIEELKRLKFIFANTYDYLAEIYTLPF